MRAPSGPSFGGPDAFERSYGAVVFPEKWTIGIVHIA